MKKEIMALMAGVLVVSVLAGCGSSESSDNGNKDSNGEGTITLSVLDPHAYGLEEYDEVIAAFEKEHPNVKIEVQHVANDTTIIQSRINSGDVPDVFAVLPGTVSESYYSYAYNWTEDTEVTGLFRENALEMCKDGEGNVMALPWSYENMGLLYNKDCFEKAGITELPTTMDELEEACKKLEAAGITPIALAAKEGWVLSQLATHFMMDKSMDASGTAEALKSGELTFEILPHWQNLFRFLDLAQEYGPNKPLEVDWEISENMLANGEAAIIHMGDWCQPTLDSFNPDANLGFLPVPVGDGEEDSTLLSSISRVYMVNKDSENLGLAKEYCEYILTSDMGQYWICEGIGTVPGVKTDREVTGKLANDAMIYIQEGKTNGWIHSVAPQGYAENLGSYLQAYMTGDMDAEEITKTFQEYWTNN